MTDFEFASLDTAKVEPPTGKHTQGTWRLEKQVEGQFFTAIGGPIAIVGGEHNAERDEYVIGICSDFGPHGPVQTEANARLIAASPDLLAACAEMVAVRDTQRKRESEEFHLGVESFMAMWDEAEKKCIAALAKAKGESK